jgi:hypothetical protein
VFSVSTRDVEGPGDCGSQVFINEESDVAGNKAPGDITTVGGLSGRLPNLGLFYSNAKLSGFPHYQHLTSINLTVVISDTFNTLQFFMYYWERG